MLYREVIEGIFIEKKNRFIGLVEINGIKEEVHIKNTGRLSNLLIRGVVVSLEVSDSLKRKTKYDLIAVMYHTKWVNIDSQANNKVMLEYLKKQDYDFIKSEYVYKDSRIDFYLEKDDIKYLLEVKGCTLEIDGVGYFPDAVSKRASKHIRELAGAIEEGYHPIIAFVIGIPGIAKVEPYWIDQEFVDTFNQYKEKIDIWYMETDSSNASYEIISKSTD